MKRYIKASFMNDYKDNYAIPEPFNQWYECASDEEVTQLTRWPGSDYICEECEGYDAKHICWAVGKTDEIRDQLMENGIEVVELIRESGSKPFLAYVVGDEICALDLSDIPEELKEDPDWTEEDADEANRMWNLEADELNDID